MTTAPQRDAPADAPARVWRWRPDGPVDVRRTLGMLAKGPYDPVHTVAADGAVWRASRMPAGPVTMRVTSRGDEVVAQLWGPGADEAADELSPLLGRDDDWSGFDPRLDLVAQARRRHPGLRLPTQRRIFETLVPIVIEQRVPGVDAYASWRRLVRRFGTPAPGPVPRPMWAPPSPQEWRTVPSWAWHRAGVDPGRSRTIVAAAQRGPAIERLVDLPAPVASRRLGTLDGVGAWTVAEVMVRLGDGDAVSVGDYHLAKDVGFLFDGVPGDDARMLELVEPWRPHRGRLLRLLLAAGALGRPRRGPRITREDHRTR